MLAAAWGNMSKSPQRISGIPQHADWLYALVNDACAPRSCNDQVLNKLYINMLLAVKVRRRHANLCHLSTAVVSPADASAGMATCLLLAAASA